MTSPKCDLESKIKVEGDNVQIEDDLYISSEYLYQNTEVETNEQTKEINVKMINRQYSFRTLKKVPKTGVLLVGFGGNNGSTVLGGIIANRENITWNTKSGLQKSNYYGSLTQSSTTYLGIDKKTNKQIYVPLKNLLPMLNPNDLIISGWDINNANLNDAMKRAQVFDYNLQEQLTPYMKQFTPLPSIYYPDFIAANQFDRANNILKGQHASIEHLNIIRNNIKKFKLENQLDKVIIVWTANTERYSDVIKGIHDTEDNIMEAIKTHHKEISPSQIFAIASILEGCSYINGSPQNTFCPAIIEMSKKYNVFIAGDDFKSGQTKIKSVLVDFLVNSGIKPQSIVSYNHLGNNDGKNLSAPKQFRSKEISKSNVVDDMVCSNHILYKSDSNNENDNKEEDHHHIEKPDHTVVIKYVPFVGDSKRAMDEYISSIFMNGINTIVIHNTCEDSLLAAPLIIDLIILTELFERIEWKIINSNNKKEIELYGNHYYKLDSILTILSFLLKAPLVPNNSPLVNALFKQRACIENILRACIGLCPINDMLLEYKTIDNPSIKYNNNTIQQEQEQPVVDLVL